MTKDNILPDGLRADGSPYLHFGNYRGTSWDKAASALRLTSGKYKRLDLDSVSVLPHESWVQPMAQISLKRLHAIGSVCPGPHL